IITDGITENEKKWEGEIGFALSDITVDAGTIKAIRPTNKVIYYYGDSITEGIRALTMNATSDGNSASGAYPFFCSKALNAVTWSVGYGATGIIRTGSFNTMSNAIDHLSANRPVSDTLNSRSPDAIVINHGHNDASEDSETFQSELRIALDKLTAAYSGVPVFYMITFAQHHADDVRTVASDYPAVTIVETADWELDFTDGVHPNTSGAKTAGENLAKAINTKLGWN
nr:SGNH/GDSL hydrolase family protein [Clostridia bacterium]